MPVDILDLLCNSGLYSLESDMTKNDLIDLLVEAHICNDACEEFSMCEYNSCKGQYVCPLSFNIEALSRAKEFRGGKAGGGE